MADISECLVKLVKAGQVSREIAAEAMEMFKRTKAEYSREVGPASADAAAALETAKRMRDKAAENQIAIAADVKTFQINERRVKEDPRGRNAAVAGMLSKDTLRGDNRLNDLRESDPEHPILTGPNADYKYQVARDKMYSMLEPEIEKFKPGFFNSKAILASTKRFIYERFGVNTGDAAAKAVSEGFGKVIEYGAARARAAGKVFNELEDWRVMQPWSSSRVGRFTEAEFVKDYKEQIANGGLKLFDKETNRYAAADRHDYILKKAYSDIKTEGGDSTPFSKQMRTFEFQPGQGGADAWLKLQAKYGVGNEIMAAVDRHIDHMSRSIALHETFGAHPDGQFAALMRMVKDEPSVSVKGLGWVDSQNTLKNTYNIISGKGHPVANETMARVMAGVRDLVGMASLRNLPITIVPGDTAMMSMATNFNGMSGFNVLSHVFDGKMTHDIAAHLQISAHSYIDYINNFVRKYEDQINVSGLARKVSRGIVKLTGADLWTTNGRLGFQASYLNQLAGMRDIPFEQLNPGTRDNFLKAYGFTATDWDKIRTSETFDAGNGAKYLDPSKIDAPLSERLLMAIKEQGSYAFHQPDARTQAIIQGGAVRGTLAGEAWLSAGQYKQFVLERMTTHLMRALTDGPIENRIARGAAFTLLSMAAGAVSIQTAAVLAGKDPLDMTHPKFWVSAFTRGGAGGVYGDILAAALQGDRGGPDIAAQLLGPIPGLMGDASKLITAPAREAMDESGRPTKRTFGNEAFSIAKRWTPAEWYTKLAVDRLLWDKMQVLLDPNYRSSFRRAQQNAAKQGSGFWWGPGEGAPTRAPNVGTAIGR